MTRMKISLLLLLLPFLAIAQADLVLINESEILQNEVDKGELLRLNVVVQNQGNQASNVSYLNIYLSVDRNVEFGEIPRAFGIKSLEPGETIEIPILYDISKKSTSGSYYVLVDLDPFGSVPEQNESNLYNIDGFVTILTSEVSYTKLPYPILLVHGWVGNNETWQPLKEFYKDAYGLIYGGELPFCLNMSATSTTYWEDIRYFPQPLVEGADFYMVNFDVDRIGRLNASDKRVLLNDVNSNQAAIYKQGAALGIAIKEVLASSGAEKVILIGHSMGGLASREYLQNTINWQADGHHHVAKLLTVATPNGGSNLDLGLVGALADLFSGKDLDSDAARDFRFLSDEYFGAFLDGGFEFLEWNYFRNKDINCDGDEGDIIIGLNQKSAPTDLEYSSVVGVGMESSPHFFGESTGDGVVEASRADLQDFLKFENKPSDLIIETFYQNPKNDLRHNFHTNLATNPKYFNAVIQGQDETEYFVTAPTIEKGFLYQGIISKQSNRSYFGRDTDIDSYHFVVEEESDITIRLFNAPVRDMAIDLYNASYNKIGHKEEYGNSAMTATFKLSKGEYFVDISGFQEDIALRWTTPYYIAVTVDENGIDEMEEEIEQPPLEVAINNVFSGDCEQLSYQFEGFTSDGITSWNWSFENGTPSTSNTANPNIMFDSPGTYEVTLSASDGNRTTTINQTIEIRDRQPAINEIVATGDNCGFGTGAISLLMKNGNTGHQFNWSTGSDKAHLINLQKGTYQVTVTNEFGCEVKETINLEGAERFKINLSKTPISCFGDSDGAIAINPQGGTAPYEVTVRNPSSNLIENLTNLPSGSYLVSVKDAKGCPATTGIFLVNPQKIDIEISFRERNGQREAVADVKGGTRPYTYMWANGATGITNSVGLDTDGLLVVTDANGCSATLPYQSFTTGIQNLAVSSFKLFPNPTSDLLKIELKLPTNQILDFKIFNSIGQELRNWQATGQSFEKTISLDGWIDGSYLLVVRGETGLIFRKFLKVGERE